MRLDILFESFKHLIVSLYHFLSLPELTYFQNTHFIIPHTIKVRSSYTISSMIASLFVDVGWLMLVVFVSSYSQIPLYTPYPYL